ncbi:MAG: AraC family transcriptional regulator [Dysgonamonadaceae bacterium]|nr:AraC family transcriptional regulator [Dysgonamonadaceae bacterium]
MNELYTIISIFVTGGLMLATGMIFIFTVIPERPLLSNYRKARSMMSVACFFFAAAGIAEYLLQDLSPSAGNISLMQTVTLAIAASQALLFTFAMLSLLNVQFPGWRYIFSEASFVLLFIVAVSAAYIFLPDSVFKIAFYGFASLYALLMAHYTFLFIKNYRRFRTQMDNYFSDVESGRMRWIAFSFFAALTVGVTALLSSIFMSTLVALIFAVIFDTFYIYFAVRFINYAHRFHVIERAMNCETPAIIADTPCMSHVTPYRPSSGSEVTGMNVETFAMLEKRIEEWTSGKGFTKRGITIDALAATLGTNSKYLSLYINTCKKQTFRKWINELRIEEAKTLLRQSRMTVHEIALHVGYSYESHFGQQFRASTHISPSGYRQQETR